MPRSTERSRSRGDGGGVGDGDEKETNASVALSEAFKRVVALREKLEELGQAIDDATKEGPVVEPAIPGGPRVSGPTDHCVVDFEGDKGEILVKIGTSKDAEEDKNLVDQICKIVATAYGSVGKSKCMDHYDAMDRLEMGDDGVRANRVLHLAYKGTELVGCASSTFSPGWTFPGCGHWGLLAVDPAHQGCGVATALVLAAERRLATVSQHIQIEFRHTEGEEFSDRLLQWYEGKLGFQGGPRPGKGQSCFRRCLKSIPEEQQRWGHCQRLVAIRTFLESQLTLAEEDLAGSGMAQTHA